jgi:hypothetical protein
LQLAKKSLDEAPYKLSGAVAKLASITFKSIGFFLLDQLNLGFLLREKLAAIFIIPSFWGFPTGRSFTPSSAHHL